MKEITKKDVITVYRFLEKPNENTLKNLKIETSLIRKVLESNKVIFFQQRLHFWRGHLKVEILLRTRMKLRKYLTTFLEILLKICNL